MKALHEKLFTYNVYSSVLDFIISFVEGTSY